MAEITPEPFVLEDAELVIDVDDYAAAVSAVAITPQTSTKTFKGLKKTAKFTKQIVDSWLCTLTLAQDWENATSLANYLFDEANEGVTKTATFRPIAGGVGFTVNLVIVPSQIGGAGGDYTTAEVTLGVEGRPEKVAAA